MVSVRKRRHTEEDVAAVAAPAVPAAPSLPPTLLRLRNMWQFACLCQWFYIFGSIVKVDNLDIDDLEVQCMDPHSMALQDLGLALLKFLSSHRGLTHDLFDEYTRRQYVAKAPEKENPFGRDEIPAKFSEFDVFQKIRVLHQMTQFIMMNSEKLREKMAEQKDADHTQTAWRIEPFGWDSNDYSYYILDDNRVYRLIDTPPTPDPPARPKKNTKKARAEARRKRRRTSGAVTAEDEEAGEIGSETVAEPAVHDHAIDDGLGGMKWDCVAVTLDEVRQFLATIPGKKDANEKILRDKISTHLVPILEHQEERQKKKEREYQKELLNLAKMATAKRSSRIANRQELHRHEELLREEEQKRRRELEEERKEEQKRRKLERERDNRLMSREKRLRDRDIRRAQYEEELAQLSEGSRDTSIGVGRTSERKREAEIEKSREALRELEQEQEEEWSFDCVCGLHGKVDDGQHSVACEKCNIWQHSRCLGINEEEAEKDDFHFICDPCRRRAHEAETANRPAGTKLPVIKIKVNRPLSSTAAMQATPTQATGPTTEGTPVTRPFAVDVPATSAPTSQVALPGGANGIDKSAPALQPAQAAQPAPQSILLPGVQPTLHLPSHPVLQPVLQPALQPPTQHARTGIPVKAEAVPALPATVAMAAPTAQAGSSAGTQSTPNGTAYNAFSSPHPALSVPGQSPRKSHAYETIYDQSSPLAPHGEASLQKTVSASPSPFIPSASPVLAPRPANGAPKSSPTAQGHSPSLVARTPLAPPQTQRTPSSVATPRLQHPHGTEERGGLRQDQASSPLVPSQGGLSPTKHSPVIVGGSSFTSSSPTPPIFPPVAALSPSPPEQNLSPPVKPGVQAQLQPPVPQQPPGVL